ncbi:MAG: hypothetical protein WD557_14735 [Dehalococcoidia bacterium]
MKLLVLGNSDYNGSMLDDGIDAWPHLVGRRLSDELGIEVEVLNRNLIPSRRDAVATAEALIAEHHPELVVVGLNPYSFAITRVATRIRKKLGERAYRGYVRVEQAFDSRTRDGRIGSRVNRAARRVARSTIGVAPLAPVEQIIETYRTVFARLSREEDMQAVIMGGSKLSLNAQMVNAKLLAQVGQFRIAMSDAAHQHRFAFFDTEPTVAGPDRESWFLPDGVHRNEAGHARLADMIYPVIAEEVRRLGLVAAGG